MIVIQPNNAFQSDKTALFQFEFGNEIVGLMHWFCFCVAVLQVKCAVGA